MAKLAVLASGGGSNFQALAEALAGTEHRICCLIADQPGAYALERARLLGLPGHLVSYSGRERQEVEKEILRILQDYGTEFVALAGFMRLLSPVFVDVYRERIVNIHPSLLPKYPGTRGIQRSFASEDRELGITIHYVDYGLDSGPIILQESFIRSGEECIGEIEEKIHQLEHRFYPQVLRQLLDALDGKGEER